MLKTNAVGGRIAVAHNGNLTHTAALAGHLIPQESLPGWPVQPRASSDADVIAERLARGGRLVAGGGDRPHHAPALGPSP